MQWYVSGDCNLSSDRMVQQVIRVLHSQTDISFSSSGRLFGGKGDGRDQSAGDCLIHKGPIHHSSCWKSSDGKSPLDALLHFSGRMSSMMEKTLLPTNVLKHLGLPESLLRTMVLSIQAWTWEREISSTWLTWWSSWANRWAPHNSRWGIVNRFIGATFVFEVTRVTCVIPRNWSFVGTLGQHKHALRHHRSHEVQVRWSEKTCQSNHVEYKNSPGHQTF